MPTYSIFIHYMIFLLYGGSLPARVSLWCILWWYFVRRLCDHRWVTILTRILKYVSLSINTKLNLSSRPMVSVGTYSTETWTLIAVDSNRINAFQNVSTWKNAKVILDGSSNKQLYNWQIKRRLSGKKKWVKVLWFLRPYIIWDINLLERQG